MPEAMKRVVDEAREGAPQVDWAKLEARLFDDEGELREELRETPSAALTRPTAAPPARRFAPVAALGLAGRPLAVEVNAEVVPRARLAACMLKAGDRIEIVTLVGGG